jgi:hypothetical protein
MNRIDSIHGASSLAHHSHAGGGAFSRILRAQHSQTSRFADEEAPRRTVTEENYEVIMVAGMEIRLNGADGFEAPTVCQCDFLYPLVKAKLHSPMGNVSWERQQQIKAKVKEVLRW